MQQLFPWQPRHSTVFGTCRVINSPPPPFSPHLALTVKPGQTPQDSINEMTVWKMNQLVIVDFGFISSFLHE